MASRSRNPARGEAGLVQHTTEAERRLFEVSAEHERLLREVRKKQASLVALRQNVERLQTALALYLEPVERQVSATLLEVTRSFERVLATASKLSRRQKARVRESFVGFRRVLGLDANEAESSVPQETFVSAHAHVTQTAVKPDVNAATLHATFRRLVNAVHPDKVQSRAEKEERTALLKRITRAYETHDLASLVEFEGTLLAAPPAPHDDEHVKRRIMELSAGNSELRRQLQTLARERRSLTRFLPAELCASSQGDYQATVLAQVAVWQERLERLQATLRVLIDIERGNTDALAWLDESWREAAHEVSDARSRRHSAESTALTHVDAHNAQAVLAAFAQRRAKARRR